MARAAAISRVCAITDEDQHDLVALAAGFLEKGNFVTMRIGKYRFENEALSLLNQIPPKPRRQLGGFVGTKVQLRGQIVRDDEAQSGVRQVSVKERGFARPVRSGDRNDDRPAIEKPFPIHAFRPVNPP